MSTIYYMLQEGFSSPLTLHPHAFMTLIPRLTDYAVCILLLVRKCLAMHICQSPLLRAALPVLIVFTIEPAALLKHAIAVSRPAQYLHPRFHHAVTRRPVDNVTQI